MKTLGIIDIGSNSIKLIIVQINNDNSYNEIFHQKFQTRLSDYIEIDSKELSILGMKNLFDIIFTFRKYCDEYYCNEIISVATESFRQLKNSQYIINNIKSSLNINIKILSPDEECYYGYLSSFPSNINNYIHLDIGGGSVEIGLIKNNALISSLSIPMGALNITNRFHIKDGISNNEIIEIKKYIYDKLKDINWIDECNNLPVIVIGGSIKTIGRIHQKEQDLEEDIHGYKLYSNDIDLLLNKFSALTLEDIIATTGISKTRGDILLGALIIISSILTYLNSSKIIISKYTIREGLVKNYINHSIILS